MTPPRSGGDGSPTATFFAELAARGHEPLLKSTSGTIRFDLVDDAGLAHWYVTVEEGDVAVSHKRAKADAVVRLERRTFDGMATGAVNVTAAVLRGEVVPDGDLGLLMLFQRVLPSPPKGLHRREVAAHG